MGDTFALTRTLDTMYPSTALIVGAGYVGLEMAEGLTTRGLQVTQVEMLPEVLPTVDPALGALIHAELSKHAVDVHTRSTVTAITRALGRRAPLHVDGTGPDNQLLGWDVDLVLVVVGVRPDTDLLGAAGAKTGPRGAVVVDQAMATQLPHIWAAGDCVATHHQLLGLTYLPLGTTAHKQGRVAGENAIRRTGDLARFGGTLGTQVVKVFDLVAARTGLRDDEATAAGYTPVTTQSAPYDHKAYYPGASPITIRITGDSTQRAAARRSTRRRPPHRNSETRRHLRHRSAPRHDRRPAQRPRSLVHAAVWLALGRGPSSRPGVGARTTPSWRTSPAPSRDQDVARQSSADPGSG
jgi:NADPH-dependent 2,4-dienoyl-CoA reductase/sulfur reductase-like enzyme